MLATVFLADGGSLVAAIIAMKDRPHGDDAALGHSGRCANIARDANYGRKGHVWAIVTEETVPVSSKYRPIGSKEQDTALEYQTFFRNARKN